MIKRSTQLLLGCLLAMFLVSADAFAQISLNPFTTSYSQNFDGLPVSGSGIWAHNTQYFPGWYLYRTAPVSSTITAGIGSQNAGGLYSFGLSGSSDRALGSVTSASADVGEFAWGLLIQNNTGHTITALQINYTGEQWRSARLATPQHKISFWYAVGTDPSAFNLSPKSDAGWTNVKELDFLGPVFYAAAGALDGNAPANKRFLSASIPVNIPDKGYVMLRWKDLDEFENDHGLAIDDFMMTWTTDASKGIGIMPVELVNFTARQLQQQVQLQWATASEKDNSHFIVERSPDGRVYSAIGTVQGKGTSATRSNYSFADEQPVAGKAYYRLKQVDFDGTSTYSKAVAIQVKPLAETVLFPTITSGKLSLDLANEESLITVLNMAGQQVYTEQLPLQARKHTLDVSQLKAGAYFLLMQNSKGEKQVLRFVKR